MPWSLWDLTPVTFLVIPRVIAGILDVSDYSMLRRAVSGMLAGFGRTYDRFGHRTRVYGRCPAVFLPVGCGLCVIKSFVFGFVITSISSIRDIFASGGAEAVGYATTRGNGTSVVLCATVTVSYWQPSCL